MQASAQPLELPKMRMLHQRLSVLPAVNVLTEMEREWSFDRDLLEQNKSIIMKHKEGNIFIEATQYAVRNKNAKYSMVFMDAIKWYRGKLINK